MSAAAPPLTERIAREAFGFAPRTILPPSSGGTTPTGGGSTTGSLGGGGLSTGGILQAISNLVNFDTQSATGLLGVLAPLAPNIAGGITRARRRASQSIVAEVPVFLEANRLLGQASEFGGFAGGGLPFLESLRTSDPDLAAQLAGAFAVVAPEINPDLVRPLASRVFGPAILEGDVFGESILEGLRALDPRFPDFPTVTGPDTFEAPLRDFVDVLIASQPGPSSPPTPVGAPTMPMIDPVSLVAAPGPSPFPSGGSLFDLLQTGIQQIPGILAAINQPDVVVQGGLQGQLGNIQGSIGGGLMVMDPTTTNGNGGGAAPVAMSGGSAFRRTACGFRARAHPRAAPDGRIEWFKPVGQPKFFSKEIGQARTLRKSLRKAVRGLGG